MTKVSRAASNIFNYVWSVIDLWRIKPKTEIKHREQKKKKKPVIPVKKVEEKKEEVKKELKKNEKPKTSPAKPK